MSTEKRKSIALLTFVSRFSAIDFPVYICDSCAILDSRKRKKDNKLTRKVICDIIISRVVSDMIR